MATDRRKLAEWRDVLKWALGSPPAEVEDVLQRIENELEQAREVVLRLQSREPGNDDDPPT